MQTSKRIPSSFGLLICFIAVGQEEEVEEEEEEEEEEEQQKEEEEEEENENEEKEMHKKGTENKTDADV